MMSKDYLSQDEIDALLRQTTQSTSGKVNIDDYLSPIEQDAIGEIGNITFGSAATALSTLLGRKVDITTPHLNIINRATLDEEFPKPHVAVSVSYVDGFQGINTLVIKVIDAQIIANLMLGGDGNVDPGEPLNEIHISAVQEAMNQMMGSSATSMSAIFNRFVNISPPGIDILDVTNGDGVERLPDDEMLLKISFRLTIDNLIDSSIMQIVPIPFARELVATLMGDTSMAAPEPELPPPAPPRAQQAPPPQSAPRQSAPPPQPSVPPQQHNYGYSPPPQPQPQPQRSAPVNQRQVNVEPVQFGSLTQSNAMPTDDTNLGLLLDIPLRVTVELGRTQRLVKDILELSQGSIIELDKLAGEPVDILVNNKLIAKGEVVVIDENFGVRVTEIVSQLDRIQKLQ